MKQRIRFLTAAGNICIAKDYNCLFKYSQRIFWNHYRYNL